jgi:hypothetical protein
MNKTKILPSRVGCRGVGVKKISRMNEKVNLLLMRYWEKLWRKSRVREIGSEGCGGTTGEGKGCYLI